MKIVAIGLIALLLILRFVELDNDPPLFYTGHSQAHVTDPYHLSFAARNAVLFDEWNPLGYHRWDVFKYSLISGASYISFQLLGVSRVTANLAAIILQLGGFFFFLWGLSCIRPRGEVLLTTIFLLLNSTLFFYGRLPFLENGLVFLLGITFLLFIKFFDRAWGQILVGATVALAVLSGKLFGLLILAPILVTAFYRDRLKIGIPVLFTFVGFGVTALMHSLAFYGGEFEIAYNYYSEQTVGMYGGPPGLASVSNFIKMLISYGAESAIWKFTPFLLGLVGFALILIILTFPFKKLCVQEFIPVCFCAVWMVVGILGLMPFQYRPLRYSLFFQLPLSFLCAYFCWHIVRQKIVLQLSVKLVSIPLIFIIFWFALTQIAVLLGPDKGLFESALSSMPVTAMLAILMTVLITLWLFSSTKILPQKLFAGMVIFLCLGYVSLQVSYLYRGMANSDENLLETNRELTLMLGPGSVLTGPYMPAFTIDNELQGVIYMFGLVDVEKNLFERFPITHVATDSPNWSRAVRDFPFLSKATKIAQIVMRDRSIDLYRLAESKNPLTEFERGSIFLAKGMMDSALISLQKFRRENQKSLYGNMHLGIALLGNQKVEQAVKIMDDMITNEPNNYVIQRFCQVQYSRLYAQTKNQKYLIKSRHHRSRTQELNPFMPPEAK